MSKFVAISAFAAPKFQVCSFHRSQEKCLLTWASFCKNKNPFFNAFFEKNNVFRDSCSFFSRSVEPIRLIFLIEVEVNFINRQSFSRKNHFEIIYETQVHGCDVITSFYSCNWKLHNYAPAYTNVYWGLWPLEDKTHSFILVWSHCWIFKRPLKNETLM